MSEAAKEPMLVVLVVGPGGWKPGTDPEAPKLMDVQVGTKLARLADVVLAVVDNGKKLLVLKHRLSSPAVGTRHGVNDPAVVPVPCLPVYLDETGLRHAELDAADVRAQSIVRSMKLALSLPMATIYDSPADFPGQIVVRVWRVMSGGAVEADAAPLYIGTDLMVARQLCCERGLVPMSRDPDDDPTILETWI